MKRIALVFGLGSGAILAGFSAVIMPLCLNGVIDLGSSEVIGYTIMVLAFILVFFGIRSYRETVGGGSIGFRRALLVGLLITVVACAVYVVAWEITYWGFFPDFDVRYSAYVLGKMHADGESAAAIAAKETQMATFLRLYRNPLYNAGMTFLEVFPIGFVITLVSAAILRRKPDPPPEAGPALA